MKCITSCVFYIFRNIAEALISKGLAYCLRHKQDDDQRSSQYDELMAAEARYVTQCWFCSADHCYTCSLEISDDNSLTVSTHEQGLGVQALAVFCLKQVANGVFSHPL